MEDLFYREQQIYDEVLQHLNEINNGESCNVETFQKVAKEYGRILRQLRTITKLSDKTTHELNSSKLDLLDKVHYDTLTGIFNRRFLEENTKHVIQSSVFNEGKVGVFMIDVDFFKRFNDTYGHSAGDICLKDIAKALKSCLLRADDFVARYGGEEFTVILPKTDESGARVMAERLLEAVRSCQILHEKNPPLRVITISVGVTTVQPEICHKGSDYFKRADEALYMSKQNGRNQYTYVSF